MNVAVALLGGGGLGMGLWLLLVAVVPAKPSLAASLAALRGNAAASADASRWTSRRATWQVQMGRAVEEAGQALGLRFRSLRKDLAVMDQALEAHLAAKVAYAVSGGLVGFALAALLAVAGMPASLVLPLWLALALAGIGWLLPDRRLRSAATARRASLRYAAGALLNLVSINLAGDEGARMREALIAMAASIGQRELAEAETKANEASEHMVLPLAVLAIGFTTFLLYPALVQLTVGF